MLSKFVKIRAANDEVLHLQDNVEAAINDIQKILAPLTATRETKTFDTNTVNEGEVALSVECGSFETSSDSYVDVTNMRVSLRTRGRPVCVGLVAGDPSYGNFSYVESLTRAAAASGTAQSKFRITRNDTVIYQTYLELVESSATAADKTVSVPPSAILHIDTPVAGYHVYQLQAANAGATANSLARVFNCRMFAYEL